MTIWEKLAKEWRIQIPKFNKDKLEEDIGGNLNIVKKTIEKSRTVPSAMDEIFADDDDDDDW
ncbi:hypothetical protein LIT38_15785 [Bacillus sp. CMF12]|uniref:hypothetical protein n=1 Tax=Bacillus sp. CMF12 TaxID=2884834 RepID=UPI00207A937E|nr:hypothetical protein [Bacillus sp. CMF12]USK48033.1 hypothetical protein LIT38_15785 [Bacillus sp. CMF12]